jgi:PAS domain S-box-containing protein
MLASSGSRFGRVRLCSEVVRVGCLLAWLLMGLLARSSDAAEPRRVLLLHSFGRQFAPFNTFSESFRTALGEQLGSPVDFHDVALESARFPSAASEGPLIDYLDALFANRPLDLVVPIGGAAARFAQAHRRELFPKVPMLIACVDERHLQNVALTPNDAVVAVENDPVRMLESILQVLPDTTNVAVVIGDSPLERFWLGETRRLFAAFTDRVHFIWLDGLSFSQVLTRAEALPARSAIFYGVFSVDADGVPYTEERALAELHAVAHVPIFGLHDSQMGDGIVGGPLMSIEQLSRNTVKVAVRILHGEQAGSIKTPVQVPGTPMYDWRELKRWHISEARLPRGSVVLFRQPTAWEQYKWRIIGNVSLCLLEALLIILLVGNLLKRRRAEQSLRESEERLSLAMAAADLGVWMLDTARNQAWASPNWRRLFGVPATAPISLETVLERVHAADRGAMESAVRRAIEGRGDYASEYRIVLPDGTQRWIAARARLAPAAGKKQARLLGVSVDITERKRAEQQVQLQRDELAHVSRVAAMGELAASVAHELNQPLGAILSNAEAAELFLQQDPPALGELREILADIRKDDERAGEVIRRMRALLRKHELERQVLDLNPLTQDVLRLVSAGAVLRKTAINSDLAPGLPPVLGDRIHLQQVLLNLILNAIEAMAVQPPEQRRLTVNTRHGGNSMVQLSVCDSGPGIPPENLPRLFEPFFTTKQSGIGMGLSISRKIVEAHHGRIWAENNPTGGAIFHVAIPTATEGAPG